ncbi:ECF transporter S component [Vagococcus sp.]|uniref:ECF transporter S component n=1 Tax=Vagococcus sp. TaxID=1933889 RepID=UPI003F9DEE30
MRKTKTEKMVVLSLLAGMAFILLKLEFFVLPTFPWLKVDFSDIPILIGTFIYGPLAGIIIAFVRSLLNIIISGANLGSLVGNIAGFLASSLYLLPIYYFLKKEKNRWNLVKGTVAGTLLMTAFMALANYFVITPLYLFVLKLDFGISIQQMVVYGVIPFNLIKGALVSVVFALTFKSLIPVLKKRLSVSYK